MGSSQSSDVSVSLEVLSQNMISLISDTENSSSSNCSTEQDITFINSGTINCAITLDQTAQLNCNLTSTFSTTNSTNLSTLVQNAVTATLASTNASVQAFLETAYSSQSNKQVVSNMITEVCNTNITDTTLNSCVANAQVTQTLQIINTGTINCGSNSTLDFGQNAQIYVLANCLTNAVQAVISTNVATVNAATAASTSNTSTQTGLYEGLLAAIDGITKIVPNIVDGIAAIGTTTLLALAAVAIAIVFGLYKVLVSPAGQKAVTGLASNAAKGASFVKKNPELLL